MLSAMGHRNWKKQSWNGSNIGHCHVHLKRFARPESQGLEEITMGNTEGTEGTNTEEIQTGDSSHYSRNCQVGIEQQEGTEKPYKPGGY